VSLPINSSVAAFRGDGTGEIVVDGPGLPSQMPWVDGGGCCGASQRVLRHGAGLDTTVGRVLALRMTAGAFNLPSSQTFALQRVGIVIDNAALNVSHVSIDALSSIEFTATATANSQTPGVISLDTLLSEGQVTLASGTALTASQVTMTEGGSANLRMSAGASITATGEMTLTGLPVTLADGVVLKAQTLTVLAPTLASGNAGAQTTSVTGRVKLEGEHVTIGEGVVIDGTGGSICDGVSSSDLTVTVSRALLR